MYYLEIWKMRGVNLIDVSRVHAKNTRTVVAKNYVMEPTKMNFVANKKLEPANKASFPNSIGRYGEMFRGDVRKTCATQKDVAPWNFVNCLIDSCIIAVEFSNILKKVIVTKTENCLRIGEGEFSGGVFAHGLKHAGHVRHD